MPEPSPAKPLLFFGCGNMGRAMLDGWIKSGFDPASFVVVDPAKGEFPAGVAHFSDISSITRNVATAIIAVKPQLFPRLADRLGVALDKDALVISVMAGVRSAQIEQALPGRRIFRLMPNLAAAIGKSPLALFAEAADPGRKQAVEKLLAPLGTPLWVANEDLMDAVTALAGSGPAFVYRFIDAISRAGEALGLDRDIAAKLAMATVDGAVHLAINADASPAELASKVASPGGTTAAGLAILDGHPGLAELLFATLEAARDRGVELAKHS